MRRASLPLRIVTAAVLLSACGEAQTWEQMSFADDEPAASPAIHEKLVGGTFTFARTEIGYFLAGGALCTATLIRPNVAVTAAHCVGYGSGDYPGRSVGQVVFQWNAAQSWAFDFDAYVSYGAQVGVDDIALLRLIQPVPAEIARPSKIASRGPVAGERISWFGYGCAQRAGVENATGLKQQLVFDFGQTDNSCPGDSGGPSLLGPDGQVFRVTSGYLDGGGGDVFGDLVSEKVRLDAQADLWFSASGGPVGGEAPVIQSPEITRTGAQDGYAYIEWQPVDDAQRYALYVVGQSKNAPGGYLGRWEAGKDTGRGTLYAWVSLSDVCRALPVSGRRLAYRMTAEVWPEADASRARYRAFDATFYCR